jgi:hypothetical protein
MLEGDKVEPLDTQLARLRSSIRDLYFQIESYKTKTAAALGGGVFMALLAMLAVYDLVAGKGAVWRSLQITSETLGWMAAVLGVSSTVLLIVGVRRARLSDTGVRAKLDSMELEYEALIERRDAGTRNSS